MAAKKLIEVALPLEKINAEAAREKSIRHGHPSTLHLWWARRPLAAARAVIWASLVDDPSSHLEEFPTEESQRAERERLFQILEDLVVWENSNNAGVLDAAKAEIWKSTGGDLPALLDPFAGGGAIPLEAQRLGLEAHAHDLNPVAVMINKAMIEIPPKFAGQPPVNPEAQSRGALAESGWSGAAGLAEDVRYYGEWMKREAFKRIGHLYPKVEVPKEQGGGEATVIAWIWARTVQSPDPLAHGAYVPLISSMMLSTKKGKKAWVEIVDDPNAKDGWRFEVKSGDLPKALETSKALGTKAGKAKDFICHITNSLIQREYIQTEGKAGRLSRRLMAIVAMGKNGRIYLSPNATHENIALSEKESSVVITAREDFLSGSTPTRAMVTGGVCSAYGLKTWGDLFTERQIFALSTFSELVGEVQKQAEADAIKAGIPNDNHSISKGGNGAKAYGEAVGVYLTFALDKAANLWSSVCGWMNDRGAFRETFARQAIPMVWDYAEANPFSTSGGNFGMFVERCIDAIAYFPVTLKKHKAAQYPAQVDCGLRNVMVSTDPPYYDNISYADLSDYFYVWMRHVLKATYPNLFNTMLVPKAEELVATPYRFQGKVQEAKEFFEAGMLSVCEQIHKYVNGDVPVTIYYAYKQSESKNDETASTGWETMLSSIINSRFMITGTWPVRTESPGRSIAQGTNALASSIVLVCRKRPEDAPQITRRNLTNTLRRELRPALKKLQESNIAPVDLAQSAIGPGMAVFSRYRRVLESDGTPMNIRAALRMINEELDLYFNEQSGDLDSASRFCIDLYTQSAFDDIAYGTAEVLANAKGVSIPAMAAHGFLYAKGGKVHLLERNRLPGTVRIDESNIWMLTQQLTQAMATGGNQACAEIVHAIPGPNTDRAKELAYRLYTVAERKNWSDEAYAYNSLVVAWPDIQDLAADMKAESTPQLNLFDGETA